MSLALTFGAGWAARRAVGARDVSLAALLRVATLLIVAAFVWLQPGIANLGGAIPWAAIAGAALAAGGGALAAGRAAAWWRPGGRPMRSAPRPLVWAAIVGVALAIALPSVASPLAGHWDSSGWMDSHSYDVFAFNIATGKVPQGSSDYMPVYQYGLAAIDLAFGHVYFAQQLVNALLALAGVAALCAAAWLFCESAAAVLVAGAIAVFTRQFYAALPRTQIETWYVPIVCIVLMCCAWYWRRPGRVPLVAFALAIAIAVNTRNQGAPLFLLLASTPLWVAGLARQTRLRHVVAMAVLVGASLLPWTLRNWVVEQRLSPSAGRTAYYLGVLNDRRVGLYGLRYWDGWNTVLADYDTRFPDPGARQRALMRAAWTETFRDPAWLAHAVFWRTLGFYGLLPPGLLDLDRMRPTNWAVEWKPFVFYRTMPLLLVPWSILIVLLRPGRLRLFLAAAVVASVSIVLVSASAEDRISYPVLPFHILLIASVWTASARRFEAPARVPAPIARAAALASAAAVALLVASWWWFGAQRLYRPLMESAITVNPAVRLEPAAIVLTRAPAQGSPVPPGVVAGAPVRLRCMLSTYMLPPKGLGPIAGLPLFASDPARETYYYAYVIDGLAPPRLGGVVPLSFRGAEVSGELREGDAAEIEAAVVQVAPSGPYPLWLQALRVRKLPIPRSAMPPFPS